MTISEKVAYLKGLAEGLELDTEKSKEGKLISVMIGILEEVGLTIEDLEENSLALGEEIDALSDDLADIEAIFTEEEDDDCGCGCGDHDHEHFHGDDFQLGCPSCGSSINITEDVLHDGNVSCDSCQSQFALDFHGEEDDEDLED